MAKKNDDIRNRLGARLQSLQARLEEIDETLRQPEDDDLEEQAVDINDDEVLMRLSRAGRDEERRIHAALERIDEGTYGKCLLCGKPIESRRLKALPEAERCFSCAKQASGR